MKQFIILHGNDLNRFVCSQTTVAAQCMTPTLNCASTALTSATDRFKYALPLH